MWLILIKVNADYEWGKYKLNHLFFMDDLKLFSKSEKQMDTPMRIVYVFSTDWDGVWNKKCGIFTMKRGKVVRCVGIKLPTREVMKEVKKRRYSYLGIFELDKIKDNKKKKKQ